MYGIPYRSLAFIAHVAYPSNPTIVSLARLVQMIHGFAASPTQDIASHVAWIDRSTAPDLAAEVMAVSIHTTPRRTRADRLGAGRAASLRLAPCGRRAGARVPRKSGRGHGQQRCSSRCVPPSASTEVLGPGEYQWRRAEGKTSRRFVAARCTAHRGASHPNSGAILPRIHLTAPARGAVPGTATL